MVAAAPFQMQNVLLIKAFLFLVNWRRETKESLFFQSSSPAGFVLFFYQQIYFAFY
jgi:hypothetical protein